MLWLWVLISAGLFPIALPSSHTTFASSHDTQTAVTDISGWRERLERLHVVLQQDIAQELEVHLKHSVVHFCALYTHEAVSFAAPLTLFLKLVGHSGGQQSWQIAAERSWDNTVAQTCFPRTRQENVRIFSGRSHGAS